MTASSTEQTTERRWQGSSIDVAAIEAAIHRLWTEEGQHEAADRRPPPVRTSVLNLVVYASHPGDAERAIEAIGGLADRLCWEQIHVTAHGAIAAHAPGVVIPLLLPELPTYLWWTGDVPFGAEMFSHVVDLCDRLIVDSALFERPIDGLVKLASINHVRSADRGVSDFHWMRLTPWRNLTA